MTDGSSSAEFHRQLRSLFAVLRVIVRRSAEGENSKNDYAAHLEGRIGALARVHDMLMRAPEIGIDLEELAHGELLVQTVPSHKYRVAGPETRIGHEAAVPMALALHELTVNALLHGALGDSEGHLEITWEHLHTDGAARLRLMWEEHGVQTRRDSPTRKGFGLELIERTLPYELDACTRVEWPQQGLRIEILLPAAGKAMFWSPGTQATRA